jgi:ATP-binding cassette subfamily C (CFTR/MRP) protein 4
MNCLTFGLLGILTLQILRLKLGTVTDLTIGQATNLLSNDLSRFDSNLQNVAYVIVGPIQAILLTWLLWTEIGVSAFAGIGFFVLYLPLQCMVLMIMRHQLYA